MPDNVDRTCAQCGYDLQGLGNTGRCPECGQYFDIFSGEGLASRHSQQTERATRIANRLRTISLAGFALAALACGGVFSMVSQKPMRPLAVGALTAAVLGLAALVSFVYEKPD